MRAIFLSTILALCALALPAAAIDHDNLDYARPLRFEDAESIAFRERAFEISGHRRVDSELLYGFQVNTMLRLELDPERVGVGVFHNASRETLTRPALGLRAELSVPTERGQRGAELLLRGALSRTFAQYSRFHLNPELRVRTTPTSGERRVVPSLTLGVSRPLGFPTVFTRTGVADLGVRAGDERGSGSVVRVGVGLRQQLSFRSVADIGLEAEAPLTGRHASYDPLRLTVGWSTTF